MALLGVNIDHVATLRQARKEEDPDPVMAGKICEANGAHSIVAHLREDRRHIQDRDILVLRRIVKKRFNLEISLHSEIVAIAAQIRPDQVTIVPERRQELTTEGGLDVFKSGRRIARACAVLRRQKIDISVFIAAQKQQVLAARDMGIRTIELHTGPYARDAARRRGTGQLRRLQDIAVFAMKEGFTVNAGHGLNYDNVRPVARIAGMHELNIGHAIIARAVFTGLARAVKDMAELIK